MSATAGPAGASQGTGGTRSVAERLGIRPGMVVLEFGYDDDCDETLRTSVAEASGTDLIDDEADEVVDVVLLWWRSDDGDLVDSLVDALGPLAASGVVWVLTPKQGRAGHVRSSDVAEAAPTAGLVSTTSISAGADWSGLRLVPPRAARRR